MSLVDSFSHFNTQNPSTSPDIIEVKDACVGNENKDDEDFKRTILLDQWRRRLRAKDFVDQLLEKEERIQKEEEARHLYFQPQMRMHFGARVDNGLMMEDQFCYHRRGIGSGNFPGSNNLSASTPVLSTLTNSSSSFNAPPDWRMNCNYNTNWVNYFPQT